MLERVQLLMRPDAWAALAKLYDEAERTRMIQAAAAEYGDARLVAAYMLDLVCSAQSQNQQGGQGLTELKVGELQFKFAEAEGQKNPFCQRAEALRAEALRARGLALRFSTPLQVMRHADN